MYLKLVDNVDKDKMSDKFKNLPDGIINRVMSLRLLKKPLFDFITSITHSVLIRSDSWRSLKTGQILWSLRLHC